MDTLILQEIENKRYIMLYLFKYCHFTSSQYNVQIEIFTNFQELLIFLKFYILRDCRQNFK